MNDNHRDLISITFTVAIVLLAIFVAHRFIVPLIWAGIIAIASWPIYEWLEARFGQRRILVASILTFVVTLVVAIPLLWLTLVAVKEARILIHYLISSNTTGIMAPDWLMDLPRGGAYLSEQWNSSIGKPQGISQLLANGHTSFKTMSDFLKVVGLQFAHRSVIFGFAIACLFFFYRDGAKLARQIQAIGEYCLQDRWKLYAEQLPNAIRATVIGMVFVGIMVGVVMGVVYGILGVPLSALFGAVTAVFAMIPFGAPIIFMLAALILVVQGHFFLAFGLGVIGTIVMFISDHFVRPVLIGGATRMHFLAVLFGILGGVETMGIVGLFIGPVIMVLFTTLWQEPELSHQI